MQLHADLGHPTPGRYVFNAARFPRIAAVVLGVLAGLTVYIAAAVGITARLHLEGESAYWMAAGVLCVLLVLVGWARFLRVRRWMRSWSDNAVAVYVVVIGLGMFGFGLWRQIVFAEARHRCMAALAEAEGAHARMRVLYGSPPIRLPTLSKTRSATTVTCEQLVHS
jgi:hypothetical protein